jgi:hypothetical protein
VDCIIFCLLSCKHLSGATESKKKQPWSAIAWISEQFTETPNYFPLQKNEEVTDKDAIRN